MCGTATAAVHVPQCSICCACAALPLLPHMCSLCCRACAALLLLSNLCRYRCCVCTTLLLLQCLCHAAAAVPVPCCCCCHIRAALHGYDSRHTCAAVHVQHCCCCQTCAAIAAVSVPHCCCCSACAMLLLLSYPCCTAHPFNICADFFGEIIILNHLHPCLCFSNLGNANQIKAILALINLLFGRMYLHWIKRISGMHSICR
jgi:hypothetical protein